jgi:hypothetical protein
MPHLIAILAAAIGYLTGGHTVQPQDLIPPIGDRLAHAATSAHASTTRRPMDAILPIGM